MDTLFALALAATIVASINVVGVTLIAATLIIPATTARLLTDSFARMLILSASLGALAGAVGMYASYWLDISAGATIVLLEAGLFCLAFAWQLVRGHRSAWAEAPVVTYHGRPQVTDDL
jgi:manganese/iron transport system permease protein/iron/zinc/copper transport system permease protein